MLERPAGVSDDDVAAAVRRGWGVDGARAEFLPVGFGAHHWRVGDLFVTLDELGVRHDAASLEARVRRGRGARVRVRDRAAAGRGRWVHDRAR